MFRLDFDTTYHFCFYFEKVILQNYIVHCGTLYIVSLRRGRDSWW